MLLDCNALIALAVEDHVHHGLVADWFTGQAGFVTSPITQGALLRFLIRQGVSAPDSADVLAGFVSSAKHRFVADDIVFDRRVVRSVHGHRQVTDAYLANLARAHDFGLATLDRGLAAIHPDVAELIAG